MGNSHSAVNNRLSKPKTNSNSPFSSPKVDAPSPPSVTSRYGDINLSEPTEAVIRGPSGDFRSRPDVRHLLKAELTAPMEVDFFSDEDDELGELATHVQARLANLSRSNSLVSRVASTNASTTRLSSLPGSKLSLVSEPTTVDLDTAVKILKELKKNAPPEDLAALRHALIQSNNLDSTDLYGRGTLSPETIAPKATPLIRRRSLATPGVATRGSPNNLVQRAWRQAGAARSRQQEEWNVGMMGVSPLTRIAGFEPVQDDARPPTPRAQTPGEMAYSHLGSLRLGSLRITNGAASPAPSTVLDRPRSTPDANSSFQGDYFTAVQSNAGAVPQKQRHGRSHSSVLPLPLYTHQQARKTRRERGEKATARTGSPLKTGSRAVDCEDEPPVTGLDMQSAPSMAADYMADIGSGPFEKPTPIPVDEHKHSSEKEESYGEMRGTRQSILFREEAFRLLDGTIFGQDDAPISDALGPEILSRFLGKEERPSPVKADSGYFSTGSNSRMSSTREAAVNEGIVSSYQQQARLLAEMQKSGDCSDSEDTGSPYTFEQMLTRSPAENSLPANSTWKDVKPRPARLTWRRSSTSIPRTASTPPTPLSVASRSGWSDTSSAQRKLQKRQSSSQNVPIVQTCRPVIEGSIPNIPDTVRTKYTRRLSETPGMDHLTKTFASVSETVSSVDGIEFGDDLPQPVTPSNKPRRHARSQSARPGSPSRGLGRRLSIFRRNPDSARLDKADDTDVPIGLVDLGTVAQSLGGSPYDIAISNVGQPVASPTHPHQLGNAVQRPKLGMDDATAATVSQMRSRSRQRSWSRGELPRSHHEFNLEAGEAVAARISRRRSLQTSDVPPVPSIGTYGLSSGGSLVDVEESPKGTVRPRLYTRDSSVSQFAARCEGPRETIHEDQPDWEAHSRHWRQRLRNAKQVVEKTEESPLDYASTTSACQSSAINRNDSLFDRYSGGLEYSYEQGLGVGGSAGTRHKASGASRKSMHFSNEYGVDLSDIPVFLQKAN